MAELTPDRGPEDAGDFDTLALLEAVDRLDPIRYRVADPEKLRPSEVREPLMELHPLIFGWMREGRTIPDERQIWDLIDEIQATVLPIVEHGARMLEILQALEEERPEPGDEGDAEDDAI